MAGLNASGLPLYRRALKQPENVKRVVDMMRAQGIKRTLERVTNQLAAGSPTGLRRRGRHRDRRATSRDSPWAIASRAAGAGIANHAEVIDVPVNLAVKVPEKVRSEDASTVTLGAIAMQGVRRAQPTLGETFVVVGLGILGQMTAQMLAANGCRVIGVDLDATRIAARSRERHWTHVGIDPNTENYVERVLKHTDGLGADGAIITAATSSNEVISEAFQTCRKKGRVVLVGDVGLELKRGSGLLQEGDRLPDLELVRARPLRSRVRRRWSGLPDCRTFVGPRSRNMQSAICDLIATSRRKDAARETGARALRRRAGG